MEYIVPDDLLYTEEHEWAKVENGVATCGITDYAQKSLSDIVYVELPEVGRKVKGGEVVGTIESVKSIADIYCPFSGEIIEVNKIDDPGVINKDPYGEGWLFKIKIEEGPQMKLLKPDEYRELIRKMEEGR